MFFRLLFYRHLKCTHTRRQRQLYLLVFFLYQLAVRDAGAIEAPNDLQADWFSFCQCTTAYRYHANGHK